MAKLKNEGDISFAELVEQQTFLIIMIGGEERRMSLISLEGASTQSSAIILLVESASWLFRSMTFASASVCSILAGVVATAGNTSER